MLDTIKFYQERLPQIQLPDNDSLVADMVNKFSTANDMEDMTLVEAQFADLYSEYNGNFENAMKHFTNMIEKVERRLIKWTRIKDWSDDFEQVHPQKWVKWLIQEIDNWIQPRWHYGWQFCVNRLMTIQKELECTFLDYGYGPCYNGDLASDIPKEENNNQSPPSNDRLLSIKQTDQPELERVDPLPKAIISDKVFESPHRLLADENQNRSLGGAPPPEPEEEPVPEDWTTEIEKSDAEKAAASTLATIESDAMKRVKKIMNDFTNTNTYMDTLFTNYSNPDWDPSTDDSYKAFPAGVARDAISTEISAMIEDRKEFKRVHDLYKSWKRQHRIDRDWDGVVEDIAKIQAATIAATYNETMTNADNVEVPVDLHIGSTYNTQMEEHFMVNTGSTLRASNTSFLESNKAIELSESVWIGDVSEGFGGEEIANTLFFDIANKDTGLTNRQNFMNRNFRYIGVACSQFTEYVQEKYRGKKVCVFVFVGGEGAIWRLNKKQKRHCYSKVVAEVTRGFQRNDVNKIPQFISDSDRLCKQMQYGKIVDKGYAHTIKLNNADPGFVGQDWSQFSAGYQTKLDGWRTQEYPTTLSVIQKVQHIMNVFSLMRTGLNIAQCRRRIEVFEYYVKHNHFNGTYQDERLNGFLMNIFDFNKPFNKDTTPRLLSAYDNISNEVDKNFKILVDYKFIFKECEKDEHFLDDVPDAECQIFLQNPPQIEEGHSYDGRL
jgi:hypothetical protein